MTKSKYFLISAVTTCLLVLVGCTQTTTSIGTEDRKINSSDWQNEYIPEFGIQYPIPDGAEVLVQSPHLTIVDKNGEHLYSIATLNSDHTRSNKPYPVDNMDWNFFLEHQPVEGVSYQSINLSWVQYHSIKDTFIPNANIGGIPMYIEANYGKLYFYYKDSGVDYYYYRAHFFIQDGLNYVRITFPIQISEDSELAKLDTDRVLAILNSNDVDQTIEEQKKLFYELLENIEIIDKFANADGKQNASSVISEKKIPASLACIDDSSEDAYKQYYQKFQWLDTKTLEYFFNDDRIKELLEGNGLYQLCIQGFSGDEVFFIIYRDRPHGDLTKNNIIGMWSRTNTYGGLVTYELYNQPMGDIGLCHISGLIGDGLFYECGGGDGPGGFNKVYILNLQLRINTMIMDCSYDYSNEKNEVMCPTDLLNLEHAD